MSQAISTDDAAYATATRLRSHGARGPDRAKRGARQGMIQSALPSLGWPKDLFAQNAEILDPMDDAPLPLDVAVRSSLYLGHHTATRTSH